MSNADKHCPDLDLKLFPVILEKALDNLGLPKNYTQIGGGACGMAYLSNNRVYKITTDKSEAIESNKLIGKSNQHIANVFNVKRINTTLTNVELFLIVLEYLDIGKSHIFAEIEEELQEMVNIVFNENLFDIIYTYQRDPTTYKNDYADGMQGIFDTNPREKFYFNSLLKIVDELKGNNIDSLDIQYHNLGLKPNGNLAFFDLGFGDTKDTHLVSMDIGEGRVKSYMKNSSAVKVADKCKFGGNADGTSNACNKGDISNFKFSKIDEGRVKKEERDDIYRDGEVIVVRPLTFQASCKYGAYTSWCTSAPSNEYIWTSNPKSVLIYIIQKNYHVDPEKEKNIGRFLQLKDKEDNGELTDENEIEEYQELAYRSDVYDLSKIAISMNIDNISNMAIFDANNVEISDLYDSNYYQLPINNNAKEAIHQYVMNQKKSFGSIQESVNDNYRNVNDSVLEDVVSYLENLTDIVKPKSGTELSSLLKTYLIGSQNIDKALEKSNDDITFYNNLMKVKDILKRFGLMVESPMLNEHTSRWNKMLQRKWKEIGKTNDASPEDMEAELRKKKALSVLEDDVRAIVEFELSNIINNEKMNESDLQTSFDRKTFDNLTSFAKRKAYADQNFQRLGAGSSRIVYRLPDGNVLKLAKNAKGIEQNSNECGLGQDNYFGDMLARIIDCDQNDLWVVSQEAKPITPQRFEELTGANFEQMGILVMNRYRDKNGMRDNEVKQDEAIIDELYENPFVSQLLELMNSYDLGGGDLTRIGSYGEINGDVVLRDYGLTQNTWKTQYASKRRMYEEYFEINEKINVNLPQTGIDGFKSFNIMNNDQIVGSVDLVQRDNEYLILDRIFVDDEYRGMGYADKALKLVLDYADRNNKIVTLTPDNTWGSSVEKLTSWYKSHGFVLNKGKNKDFQTMQLMYRLPKKNNMIAEEQVVDLADLPFKSDVEQAGGKLYSVGGAVRDKLLGKESKDLDILITGIPLDKLESILSKYGKVDSVGKSFGIIKFNTPQTGEIDIAIPRTERKNDKGGYQGFDVTSDHSLPIEKDLERRDFTINAIAKDSSGLMIDPYGGQGDIEKKQIKMVNPQAFSDDPLRMLRAVQFAARFGFDIEPNTMESIKQNAQKIREISPERILIEFDKIVKKGNPMTGAKLLRQTGLYNHIFGVNRGINLAEFKNVRTMAEFLHALTYGSLEQPAEFYKKNLKGDLHTYDEMRALEVGRKFNGNRKTMFDMYKLSPASLNTKLLGGEFTSAVQEMKNKNIPFSLKEVPINGNDVMELGYTEKGIGEVLVNVLNKIYKEELPNERQAILNYIKSQK